MLTSSEKSKSTHHLSVAQVLVGYTAVLDCMAAVADTAVADTAVAEESCCSHILVPVVRCYKRDY